MKGKRLSKPKIWRGRVFFLGILGLFAAALLCWRLVSIQVLDKDFLQAQGKARTWRTVEIPSYRGIIFDRKGEPLAVSTPVQSVWVNPKEVDFTQSNWAVLAKILMIPQAQLVQRIAANRTKEFVYLKRQINPFAMQDLVKLNLTGLHFEKEYRRFYPTGEISANILGVTGLDHQGLEGLELSFNQQLAGQPGQYQIIKDGFGKKIQQLAMSQAPQRGKDIQLTLDSRIQSLAYKTLLAAVKKNNAKAGMLVALDVDTFEILAMVNVPSFNPNLEKIQSLEGMRNRAVTDLYEPGSLIKAFSMASILGSGRYELQSVVDTHPGWFKVGNNMVRDVRNFGTLDLTTVMTKSSNVGISKLTLSLPPNNLYETLSQFGFGQRTHSGLAGENTGYISDAGYKNPFALATLSFGYGLVATPLQLAQAYAVLAAGGIKKPLSMIKPDANQALTAERIMPEAVAQIVTRILSATTQLGGTAFRARIPGYDIAAKTGTIRKVTQSGYQKDQHVALFAGFAPVQAPRVAMVVVIDEPQNGQFYGGQVAAPVFTHVMSRTLSMLNVVPNNSSSAAKLLVEQ